MSYSEKFRLSVMEYIDGGHTQSEVASLFKISKKTVWNWVNQRKKVGNLDTKKSPDRRHRKLEKGAFLQYMIDHPDAYLREIAAHFGCCKSSVDKRLKKFGISYKKNSIVQRKKRREATKVS